MPRLMARYTVHLSKVPKGHSVPRLLSDFGKHLATQQYGALGWFEALRIATIPKGSGGEHNAQLRAAGFSFVELPDGSQLVLLKPGGKVPAAVVLVSSDGELKTVANSFEGFLTQLAKRKTGVAELDEDEDGGAGRRALAAWLKKKKVVVPKAPPFKFQAWLEGGSSAKPAKKAADNKPATTKAADKKAADKKAADRKAADKKIADNKSAPKAPPTPVRKPTAMMKKLGPKAQGLASILGLRADDPEHIRYVSKVLKKKVPTSITFGGEGVHVVDEKAGYDIAYSHDIYSELYPPIIKAPNTFVPYAAIVHLRESWAEPLFGLDWSSTEEQCRKVLGEPHKYLPDFGGREPKHPLWSVTLDHRADTELRICHRGHFTAVMRVRQARPLQQKPDASTGVFIAWAAVRGLLDPARFKAHADAFEAVKQRNALGSDLIKAALPRGLWNDHLRDDDALREYAHDWFDDQKDEDFVRLFGKRADDEEKPNLTADSWMAVDKASKVLEKRFQNWL